MVAVTTCRKDQNVISLGKRMVPRTKQLLVLEYETEQRLRGSSCGPRLLDGPKYRAVRTVRRLLLYLFIFRRP